MAVKLTLYVMGGSHRSTRALRNLQRAIIQRGIEVDLEVVDLAETPERGDQDRILATPTLVRREPGPEQRVVGDLSVPIAIDRVFGPSGVTS